MLFVSDGKYEKFLYFIHICLWTSFLSTMADTRSFFIIIHILSLDKVFVSNGTYEETNLSAFGWRFALFCAIFVVPLDNPDLRFLNSF